MPNLESAVATVLERCLQIRPKEDVLVIVDDRSRQIGEALRDGASALGAEAVLAQMAERSEDGTEPPRAIAAAMIESDVVIAPTTRSLSHTRARKRACEGGTRAATMPGVTAEMLARVMAVDFDQMAARSRAVADLLTTGSQAHVTCPRGTDLRLELGERQGVCDDGRIATPGAFGNLPCGEGFIAPVGGEGRMVAATVAALGVSDPPAVVTVEQGHIVAAEGGLGPDFLSRLEAHGEPGTTLAELGVGTNDRAQMTGNILEDEKILGTVHVAFGASAGFGGTVSVPIHLDALIVDATLAIDGCPVLDGGQFVL